MSDTQKHLADGGYASRKFWMVILTQTLLIGAAALSRPVPSIVALYPTLAGALVLACALYLGGNVAAKQVLLKGLPTLLTGKAEKTAEKVEKPTIDPEQNG